MASLQKNVAGQNITFCLVNATTGAADATGTGLAGKFTLDNAAQASCTGSFSNKGNGQYNYAPAAAETNGTDVGFLFTATGDIPVNVDFHTDPVNFVSSSVDVGGNYAVTSNVKKNQAHTGFMFALTDSTTHQLKPLITFSAGQSQRSIDGAAFANTANLPTEVGNGVYTINFNASDVNGNNIAFLATPTGCDPTLLIFLTQP
jgi:hypothetical protein